MRFWKSSLILLGCLTVGACGSSTKKATVSISPTGVSVSLQNTIQFTPTVVGVTDRSVVWKVNDIAGGNATLGTISTNGLYTAPATIPNPATTITVKVVSNANMTLSATATVNLVSGITITLAPTFVTMGTGEHLTFTATLTGTTNFGVNWLVATSPTGTFTAGGSSTLGTISTMTTNGIGDYVAPATAPTTGSVTLEAQSAVDLNQTALVTISIIAFATPTVTDINPKKAAAGSVFQDFYLTGTNFLSTSSVLMSSNPVPSTLVSSTILRARAPASVLNSPGGLTVRVQPQNGPLVSAPSINVVSVRPALVSTLPRSHPADPGTLTYEFDGGYFGSGVFGEFDSSMQTTMSPNPQQLLVTIGNGSLATPGLFSVDVNNPAAATATPPAPAISAVNIAIQPTVTPAVTNTIGTGMLNLPVAVAVDEGLGIAAVVNGGTTGANANSLSLVDLASQMIKATIPLGTSAASSLTSVAVDNERDFAMVTDNGSSDVAVVNLTTHAVTTLAGVGINPFGVGIDPIHRLALVVNQTANAATVIDLSTLPPGTVVPPGPPTPAVCGMPVLNPVVCTPVTISTGGSPSVAVIPQLGWAIVTPGGAGTLTVVDLVRKSVVFTANVNLTMQGVAVNTETQQILLADPQTSFVSAFSLLDQATNSLNLELGHVAAAINPLTNIGVTVNRLTNSASVIDLGGPARLFTVPVGSHPSAVAIDPGTDTALVTNQNDGTLSFINLGALTTHPQIVQMDPPFTMTTGASLTLTLVGSGFLPGAMVRFNRDPLTTAAAVIDPASNGRRLTATIPPSVLTQAERLVVDVQNPANVFSNVENLLVIQAVTVGTAPQAVAIDPQHDIAVVTNSGSNNITVLDLSPGNLGNIKSTLTVGTNPQGVAVLPNSSQAVVANEGNGTASIIDLGPMGPRVTGTVTTGGQPRGVAINPATGFAYISNSVSNSLSAFSITGAATPSVATIAVDQKPGAMAIAPELNVLALANETSNNLTLIGISTPGSPQIFNRLSGLQLPTGVAYDPVSQVFLVLSSLGNNIEAVDPVTGRVSVARVGINPTSLAYNFQTSTLLTVNNSSNTLSVMDFPNRRVRAILSLSGGNQFSVDIHPFTNMAVVVDSLNNRVLLVPMPR